MILLRRLIVGLLLIVVGWAVSLSYRAAYLPGVVREHHTLSHRVDFSRVLEMAELANLAYYDVDKITGSLPGRAVTVHEIPEKDTRFFVISEPDRRRSTISIRGTANLANVLVDVDVIKLTPDATSTLWVHTGFFDVARQIRGVVGPTLPRDHEIVIVGHSLGGAIAAVLGALLHMDGFTLRQVMTFGQPKFTNARGVENFRFLPVVRIVDEDDLIPRVPPWVDPLNRDEAYRHLGVEIMLLDEKEYCFLEEPDAEAERVSSFWANLAHESLEDHLMASYLKRIRSKLGRSVEIELGESYRWIHDREGLRAPDGAPGTASPR